MSREKSGRLRNDLLRRGDRILRCCVPQRLKEKPELLPREWKRLMNQDADLFFYDDDWVLLVDEDTEDTKE